MLEALLDPHDHSSSGACVVLNSVLKTRGSELYLQVESLVNDLHCKLCEITCVQTRTGTLRCMRTLAYHHLIAVINCLMKYNLPYDQTVRDCWQVLAGDGATAQNVLDRLLESLARAVPFQEKPDPRERDKTKTLRIANNQPLAVLSALAEIFRADNCTATMMQNYARVFVTLLTSIGVMVDVKAPPHQKQEEKKDEKQSGGKTGPRGEDWAWDILAPSRDQVLNPSRISIEALRNFLVCTGGDMIIDGLQRIDGWKKLAVAADIPDVICNVARSLAVQKPELLTQVITAMNPSLASLYDTQRIVAVAFLGELIGHCGKADGALTEIMMNSLMTRLVDPSQSVRMLCIRGLGNVGTAGNEQVQKYSTTVLSAMMAGMDDREDKEGDITLAAMSGLSKILAAIDEHHVRGILINIALRIRPCFEKERDEVRAEAFRLFGNLSRFSDGPSRDPFLEQIHANLVSLLLHLHDSSEDVVKASKYSLRLLGPRISSSSLNDMFQKHLLDDAHLHYGEFINDLSKVLIASYPEKINFYVMGNVSFFKSSCHMIRSNAAMFTGFLLGNLPKEKQMSISKEHVCGVM
ncbi:PREDICTED: maestro heat-like repeat-containing protein family member 1 [Priapulus caudatus]|uniref:Maestro heat-like repeat-containing protein family member 1 n=1 Tax=Priapulus caudatus TaxID=37621 RepID=A0ABM1ESV9_PRICU|nr:PREDICTED: maestro heat-like repeat-containing protein family member 1 [Priapulus caudatus]